MARVLVVDDEGLMRTTVQVVCNRMGHESLLAGELCDRQAALDAALAAADWEQLRRTAHACKNSAGVMRLDRLRAAAAAAESADVSSLVEAALVLRLAMAEAKDALRDAQAG